MQLQARLHEVQGEVATVSSTLRSKSQCPEDSAPVDSDGKEVELTDKLDKLKSEFTQLLQEVRRRKSLLGDPGSAPIFEVDQISFKCLFICYILFYFNFYFYNIKSETKKLWYGNVALITKCNTKM